MTTSHQSLQGLKKVYKTNINGQLKCILFLKHNMLHAELFYYSITETRGGEIRAFVRNNFNLRMRKRYIFPYFGSQLYRATQKSQKLSE